MGMVPTSQTSPSCRTLRLDPRSAKSLSVLKSFLVWTLKIWEDQYKARSMLSQTYGTRISCRRRRTPVFCLLACVSGGASEPWMRYDFRSSQRNCPGIFWQDTYLILLIDCTVSREARLPSQTLSRETPLIGEIGTLCARTFSIW